MSDPTVHILHKDDDPSRAGIKLLCCTKGKGYCTWKWSDGTWANALPTCQACALLAMIEPENVFVLGEIL